MLVIAVPHIPRRLRRDIQQAGVLLLTFHTVVAPGQRVSEVVSDVLVEFVVLVVFDFRLVTGPQRLRLVDFFPGNHGLAVFLFGFFDLYRQRDMVGIFADDGTYAPVIEELVFAFTQMQSDFGTTVFFGNISNGVLAFARRFPEHAVFRFITRSTGTHGDFVRHDEGRVETNPELTDQLAVFRLIGAHRFEERFGAGFRNGPQMIDNVITVHPHAVIGNGQRTLIFIEGNTHTQLTVTFIQVRVRQCAETQLVCRIRGVRDKLTQEDFFIGIQRMDHQVQKLFYF